MGIGILGTGTAGQSHAAKLSSIGPGVMIWTRDPAKTLANDKKTHSEIRLSANGRIPILG